MAFYEVKYDFDINQTIPTRPTSSTTTVSVEEVTVDAKTNGRWRHDRHLRRSQAYFLDTRPPVERLRHMFVTTRRPPILISLTCTLRSDQCLTALGRHNRRRKFPRLYAKTNRDRRTRLATNRWHDSRVQFSAYLPSLIHCSAVPLPL